MFSFSIHPYTLHFNFEAGTSRGKLRQKKTWFIRLWHADFPEKSGWGECGPLSGLSPDFEEDMTEILSETAYKLLPLLPKSSHHWEYVSPNWMEQLALGKWIPSVWFALETAWLDWMNGGQRLICDPLFFAGQWRVPINGLVWMNEAAAMEKQAIEKIQSGFSTIKFKVGALNWKDEFSLLKRIREAYPEIGIRLDANGAWTPEVALARLEELNHLYIESIEQPIAPGQLDALQHLCAQSAIPIALDEELIGKPSDREKFSLLEKVSPWGIVLKPTLLGGLGQCHQWIKMAEDLGITWWITSMLESNIGLNAISQFAAQYRPTLPQGLGTGTLYANNVNSPLTIEKGELYYNPNKGWEIETLIS